MLIAVPTLDTSGWITDPSQKAARLIAYFFSSEFSQSNLYLGHVQSLPHILASTAFNFDNMKIDIETELGKLFQNYFDGSNISVEITKDVNSSGIESESKFNIVLDCRLTAEGSQISLGRELIVNKSKIEQIINLSS